MIVADVRSRKDFPIFLILCVNSVLISEKLVAKPFGDLGFVFGMEAETTEPRLGSLAGQTKRAACFREAALEQTRRNLGQREMNSALIRLS
jgi:hypothetical protein